MGEMVKLVVDLRNGTASIEAPSDVVATILEHLEVLLPKLGERATALPTDSAQKGPGGSGLGESGEESAQLAQEAEGARVKRRRSSPRSRGGRSEGFNRLLKEPCERGENYAKAIAAGDMSDRALLVLHLGSSHFGISGLSANEIAMVLLERFRQKAVRQSVQSALDRSVGKGLVHKEGPRYKLLAPGLSRVAELIEKVPVGPN